MTTTMLLTAVAEEVALEDGRSINVRLSHRHDPDQLVVCAHDPAGNLIGMATCDRAGPDAESLGRLSVCIVPGWQRAGVGSRLLRTLVAQARAEGIAFLSITFPAHEPAADRFLDASGLVVARRLGGGMIRAVVCLAA